MKCPDCNGEGEYCRGQIAPDDEGYEVCRICDGKGTFDPIARIKELSENRDRLEGLYYNLLGKLRAEEEHY